MNKNIWVGIVIIIIFLFGVLVFSGSEKNPDPSIAQNQSPQQGQIAPNYIWYSEEELSKAQQKGRAVIYFWAGWCPTCRILSEELEQRSNELPEDVTILRADYDTEVQLKKKYQIVTQHTLVQVDKNGSEITRWIGGNIDVIKGQLK